MKLETVKEIHYQLTNPLFREKTTVEVHLDGKVWVNAKTHNNLISYAGMLYDIELKVLKEAIEGIGPKKLPSATKDGFLGGDYASIGVKTTQRTFWAIFGHKDQTENKTIKRLMEILVPVVDRISAGAVTLPFGNEVRI